MSSIVPFGRIAYIPSMCDLNDPCLTIYMPPAAVDAFPPSWHDPLAPRSSGTCTPKSLRN